jgi:hypothetical protein
MKLSGALIVLPAAAIAITAAWGGHELPVYPSFYPDRIEIRSLAPEQAADALRTGTIHAYIGGPSPFYGAPPKPVRVIESLGQLVLIRVNLVSPLAKDDASACGLITTVAGELAKRGQGFVLHPYPVTPFHGDYLYHADLAEAAKARFLARGNASPHAPADQIKIKASEGLAAHYPELDQTTDWDVAVAGIDSAQLLQRAAVAVNGFEGPPWLKEGWFQAERILSGAVTEAALRQRIDGDRDRLAAGDFGSLAERINLERDLVRSLTSQCRVAFADDSLRANCQNIWRAAFPRRQSRCRAEPAANMMRVPV